MSTVSQPPPSWDDIPIPDISGLITEDDSPLDNVFSEKQKRLLTEPLYASWEGPEPARGFIAAANVGVFAVPENPAKVPDVFVVVDTQVKGPLTEKKNRSYFVWEHGKPPDAVIEIVSNAEGEELSTRLRAYERMRVPHYVVFDPFRFLSDVVLRPFASSDGFYQETEGTFLRSIGLGLQLWTGEYENERATWLRWCREDGSLILTGRELAEQAQEQAKSAQEQAKSAQEQAKSAQEQAKSAQEQAEAAEQRAARLAAKLLALGIDPES